MLWVIVPILVVGSALGFAFRPELAGQPGMWLALALPYGALTAVALYRMMDDGTLLDRFRIRSGDITIAVTVAALLLGAAWGVQQLLLAPDSPRAAWAFRILLQLGSLGGATLPVAVVLLGAMEEIVWRGLVLDALVDRLGSRRAWPLAAVAYAVAHLPTVVTLRDPEAGPNPLLVLAALGAGLCWSFAAARLGRLPPVILSHVVFGYFAPAMLLPELLR
jgi:uncharacterized protein